VIKLSSILEPLVIGLNYFIGNLATLFIMLLGIVFGLIFGCIPGLTAALAVALILPFTYGMSPQLGISLLIAIYVGGISGGLYGATLLNIPGTPAALVTTFDGYPLAKKGFPALALSLGIFSSFVGGIFSSIVLITVSPFLARVSLMFGPWEYFALGIMGLSVVITLCSEDLIKGLIGASIGVIIATVGMDPVLGVTRFTFGKWQLNAGLPLLATLMGFFAVCEILRQTKYLNFKAELIKVKEKVPLFPPLGSITKHKTILAISAVIGTWIGILPGVGQSTGSLIAYNQARQMSKNPEVFGKGCEEGVIASETANNAVNGGALIPMMTLGIPGDLVTAILLGGLIIHGLQPGPLLFRTNIDIVGVVFIAYFIANIMMFFVAFYLLKFFVSLLRVSPNMLFTVILVMCVLGTYTVNNRLFDVWVLLGTGILGYVLLEMEFRLPPIILGYILSPIIEQNFRTAYINSRGNLLDVVTRPLSGALLFIALIFLVYPYFSVFLRKRKLKNKNL